MEETIPEYQVPTTSKPALLVPPCARNQSAMAFEVSSADRPSKAGDVSLTPGPGLPMNSTPASSNANLSLSIVLVRAAIRPSRPSMRLIVEIATPAAFARSACSQANSDRAALICLVRTSNERSSASTASSAKLEAAPSGCVAFALRSSMSDHDTSGASKRGARAVSGGRGPVRAAQTLAERPSNTHWCPLRAACSLQSARRRFAFGRLGRRRRGSEDGKLIGVIIAEHRS